MRKPHGTTTRDDSSGPCRCPGPPTRREFLKVGVVTGLGLTLGDYFRLQEAQAEEGSALQPKAQSVIFIFMAGGMSHMDTFDPKPNAPLEYRGELGTLTTNTGEVIGGLLPNLGKVADKYSVIRSMTHGEAAHERGTHNMLTGYRPSPAIAYPSFGAVVAHEYGPRQDLPPYICVPSGSSPYLGTGYLSSAYGPFSVGGEPANEAFQVQDLNLPDGVTPERMESRKTLLQAVDHHFKELEQGDSLAALDSYYQRAYSLISSQHAREAFDVRQEDEALRASYGKSAFGQRLVFARRLVEAGARFVTVMDSGWDHHGAIKRAMENQLPPVDQGVAALLTDLDSRGLLASTLVVLATEFGRTTRLNGDGGRDHWPKAFSVLMAGGGIQGGHMYGRTDTRGSEPTDSPVSPEDMASTMFSLLGIDPKKKLMSAGNRPVAIVRGGNVLADLV